MDKDGYVSTPAGVPQDGANTLIIPFATMTSLALNSQLLLLVLLRITSRLIWTTDSKEVKLPNMVYVRIVDYMTNTCLVCLTVYNLVTFTSTDNTHSTLSTNILVSVSVARHVMLLIASVECQLHTPFVTVSLMYHMSVVTCLSVAMLSPCTWMLAGTLSITDTALPASHIVQTLQKICGKRRKYERFDTTPSSERSVLMQLIIMIAFKIVAPLVMVMCFWNIIDLEICMSESFMIAMPFVTVVYIMHTYIAFYQTWKELPTLGPLDITSNQTLSEVTQCNTKRNIQVPVIPPLQMLTNDLNKQDKMLTDDLNKNTDKHVKFSDNITTFTFDSCSQNDHYCPKNSDTVLTILSSTPNPV